MDRNESDPILPFGKLSEILAVTEGVKAQELEPLKQFTGFATRTPNNRLWEWEQLLMKLAENRKQMEEAHARNIPKIESNRRIRAIVTALMENLGLPKEYRAPKANSRAYIPRMERHDAGWVGDLNRWCPISDGYEMHSRTCDNAERIITEGRDAARKAAEDRIISMEQHREKERKEREANLAWARVILNHRLGGTPTWSEIKQALCEKDQRVRLALAMMHARESWEEGHEEVLQAFRSFKPLDSVDAAIFSDVAECIANWDGDGRIYRDTRWNYDAILATVEQTLRDDAVRAYNEARNEEVRL